MLVDNLKAHLTIALRDKFLNLAHRPKKTYVNDCRVYKVYKVCKVYKEIKRYVTTDDILFSTDFHTNC